MDKRNLINGKKSEPGNPAHIQYYKEQVQMMSGEKPVSQIEWQPCHYWGKTTDTGKPKYRYCDSKYADALVDMVPCPRCGRLHVILIPFDPAENFFDELIHVDRSASTFQCWNCKLEFIVDEDRYVYVKQNDSDHD